MYPLKTIGTNCVRVPNPPPITSALRRRGGEAGFTIVEFMITMSLIAVMMAIALPALGRAREAVLRTYCMNNMRELGRMFIMYSDDNQGEYPPGAENHIWGERVLPVNEKFHTIRNNYTLDTLAMRGYLEDYKILTCRAARIEFDYPWDWWFTDVTFTDAHVEPGIASQPAFRQQLPKIRQPRPDLECLTNQMYTYIPFAVGSESEMLFLFNELDAAMDEGLIDFMDEDFQTYVGFVGTAGTNQFLRVRQGIERTYITDLNNVAASYRAESSIPVLFDTASLFGTLNWNHIAAPGGNVLYMDGSVQYVRFAEESAAFPYTPDMVEWLRRNTYNNGTLQNIPPWCSNRAPGVPFEPRYRYYPSDPLYEGLRTVRVSG